MSSAISCHTENSSLNLLWDVCLFYQSNPLQKGGEEIAGGTITNNKNVLDPCLSGAADSLWSMRELFPSFFLSLIAGGSAEDADINQQTLLYPEKPDTTLLSFSPQFFLLQLFSGECSYPHYESCSLLISEMDPCLNKVPVTTKSEALTEGHISGHSDSDVPGFDGQHNEGERMSWSKAESGTLVFGFLTSIYSFHTDMYGLQNFLKMFWICFISIWPVFKGILKVHLEIKVMWLFMHSHVVPTQKIWRRWFCPYNES